MDVLALGTWSAMLFRYWFSGKLLLLLHPDYAWLSNTAAIVLLAMALFTLFKAAGNLFSQTTSRTASQPASSGKNRQKPSAQSSSQDHITLLPPSLSSALLLGIAVFGLIYTPQAFASQTAAQRGLSDSLALTRSSPQQFARAANPDDRTIIDWMRLINVYPEPDEYSGKPVNVEGFVMYPEGWPDGYLMVSRFVLTCCAADAYPVGLPVKLSSTAAAAETADAYKADSWIAVKGEMVSETFDGRRQVAIAPTEIKPIEEPKNPYEY